MSEYQYYEFLAIDCPLEAKQMAALRALSTRAEITSTRFTNVYSWGDFKGSPEKLMEQYFDAHVYVANWGTQLLMLRLPKTLLSKEMLAPYCVEEGLHGWTKGEHLIIEWHREGEPGDDWVEGEGWMARLMPIREELERGDYRALYLGWLAAASLDDISEETSEPPVPMGLGALTAAQHSLVEFLSLDEDFLAAAAQASPPVSDRADSPHEMVQWVAAIPADEARQYLLLLLQGKAKQAEREMRQKYTLARRAQGSPTTAASEQKRRTLAELHTLTERARAEHLERKKRQQQRTLEKQRQQREQYLATLTEDFEQHWREVEDFVAQQIASAYDRARDLLVDLSEAYTLKQNRDEFLRKFAQFRAKHSRRSALSRRLDKAGLK
ncbi:MAG: hypothetical protein HY268_20215 [Deltaproteobacteria bacterium]|nr:hypothetical protein [Deltaproteobacteria bacterium]